jgi:hypothetical protein
MTSALLKLRGRSLQKDLQVMSAYDPNAPVVSGSKRGNLIVHWSLASTDIRHGGDAILLP